MLSKILSLFFKKNTTDPLIFCKDKNELKAYLSQKNILDTNIYIKDHLTKALGMLIYDDRFNRELLDKIESLALDVNLSSSEFSFYLDKARIKFDMVDELKADSDIHLRYPDNISFDIEATEIPLWQWDNISILASYKPVVLGKDVLNACGCVTKVRDCCVGEDKDKNEFIKPELLSFAKIEDNTVLVTDRHLYIKSSKSYDKVLIDDLVAKYISARGFAISTEALKGRFLIFKINDPLFMNLLLTTKHSHSIATQRVSVEM